MNGIEKLNELLRLSEDPILIKNVEFKLTGSEVILNSSISLEDLTENYVNGSIEPPKWYKDLLEIKDKRPILIIDKINSVDEKEQAKFIDIIKYKKINSFSLPKNTIILLTYYSSEKYKLNESISSLVMHM